MKKKKTEYQTMPIKHGFISGNRDNVAFTFSVGKGHIFVSSGLIKKWGVDMNKCPKYMRGPMKDRFDGLLLDCEFVVKGITGVAEVRGNAYWNRHLQTFEGSGALELVRKY